MPAGKAAQAIGNIEQGASFKSNADGAGDGIFGSRKKGEKLPLCQRCDQTGTELANYSLDRCAASTNPGPTRWQHGGARNSASRTSDCLTMKQARKLINAVRFQVKKTIYNRHITIHWGAAGVEDDEAMAATTAFLKVLRDWTSGKASYVWVRENGIGKGSHVHILTHIPDGKHWHGARVRRWLERISGKPYKARSILTRRIMCCDDPNSELYQANLNAVLAYVLKGVSPDDAAALGIAHEAGGRIIGKRCGMSKNISKRAGEGGSLAASKWIAQSTENPRSHS